jgi:hypothetical protein
MMAMLAAQVRKVAVLTALILVVVVTIDFVITGVLFPPSGASYSPLVTIIITLAVAPPFSFYLIYQADRVQLAQGLLARERTQHLAEVEAARDAAEAATRAKSEFVANMSHEIRTPLNGVLGMAQALEAQDLSPDVRAMVGTIRESGVTLLAILNDVLDLSKIEAGRLEISPVDAAPVHTIGQVHALFTPVADEKGVSLVLDNGIPKSLRLHYDQVRVRQCVSNLIANAVKFTNEGRIVVQTSIATAPNGRSRITVEVADTGIGMDEIAMRRLFSSFSQADGSTTRKFGGTGLGLAISRRLARLMGGDIIVRSMPHVGSVFTFSFLADPADATDLVIEPAPERHADSRVRLRGARVLLTDDNAINRQVVRLFLQPQGAHITEASNGQEALDALGAQPFDLVLLDLHMPVMDGAEAIRQIRASTHAWRDIPVIALTADAMAGDRERLLMMGMSGYVSKPVDQDVLLAAIGAALGAPIESASATVTATETPDDLGDVLAELDRLTG